MQAWFEDKHHDFEDKHRMLMKEVFFKSIFNFYIYLTF